MATDAGRCRRCSSFVRTENGCCCFVGPEGLISRGCCAANRGASKCTGGVCSPTAAALCLCRGFIFCAAAVLACLRACKQHNTALFTFPSLPPSLRLPACPADYRFELAVSLGMLDLALELAGQSDSEAKWSQLGELALGSGQLEVAQQCFGRAKDLGGLLLLHSSHADAKGMGELAALAGGLRRQSSGCGAQLSAVHAALWERCLGTAGLASSGCRQCCWQSPTADAGPSLFPLCFVPLTCIASLLPPCLPPSLFLPCRGRGQAEHCVHLPLFAGQAG